MKNLESVGVSPHFFINSSLSLFLSVALGSKEKATPIRHPFGIPCVCSTGQAAAELALRAQTVLAEIP